MLRCAVSCCAVPYHTILCCAVLCCTGCPVSFWAGLCFVLILLFSASVLVMKEVCNMQPKMRAKFKVSFQSGDKHPEAAEHISHSVSDESEGCLSSLAALLLSHRFNAAVLYAWHCICCIFLPFLGMTHACTGVHARAANEGRRAQPELFHSTARHQARCVMHTNPLCLAYSCPVTCLPDIGRACVLHTNTLNLSGSHATQHSHLAM
jgi:hypothetical protein